MSHPGHQLCRKILTKHINIFLFFLANVSFTTVKSFKQRVNEKEMQNKRKANERSPSCAAVKWHDGHVRFVSADAVFQIIYGQESSKTEGDERMKATASFVDSTMVILL